MSNLSAQPRFLTEKEASDLYKFSRSWFQKKRWQGGGPPFLKIGPSAVRYEAEKLEAWMKGHMGNAK